MNVHTSCSTHHIFSRISNSKFCIFSTFHPSLVYLYVVDLFIAVLLFIKVIWLVKIKFENSEFGIGNSWKNVMSILKLFGTWLPRTLCNILQEGIWTQDDFTYVLKPIFGDESTETSAKHPHVLIKFKDLKNTILPGEKISLKKSIVKSFQKDDVGRYLLSFMRNNNVSEKMSCEKSKTFV